MMYKGFHIIPHPRYVNVRWCGSLVWTCHVAERNQIKEAKKFIDRGVDTTKIIPRKVVKPKVTLKQWLTIQDYSI